MTPVIKHSEEIMVDKRKTKYRYINRYKNKKRKRPKRTIAVIPTIAVGNYLMQVFAGGGKLDKLKEGDIAGYMEWVGRNAMMYGTGYDPVDRKFRANDLMRGTGMIVLSALVHKAMNMLGVNRYFSNLPKPLDRIRL